MTAEEILTKIQKHIKDKRNEVYDKISFCNEHNFTMEASALRYESMAYSDVQVELMTLLDDLETETK